MIDWDLWDMNWKSRLKYGEYIVKSLEEKDYWNSDLILEICSRAIKSADNIDMSIEKPFFCILKTILYDAKRVLFFQTKWNWKKVSKKELEEMYYDMDTKGTAWWLFEVFNEKNTETKLDIISPITMASRINETIRDLPVDLCQWLCNIPIEELDKYNISDEDLIKVCFSGSIEDYPVGVKKWIVAKSKFALELQKKYKKDKRKKQLWKIWKTVMNFWHIKKNDKLFKSLVKNTSINESKKQIKKRVQIDWKNINISVDNPKQLDIIDLLNEDIKRRRWAWYRYSLATLFSWLFDIDDFKKDIIAQIVEKIHILSKMIDDKMDQENSKNSVDELFPVILQSDIEHQIRTNLSPKASDYFQNFLWYASEWQYIDEWHKWEKYETTSKYKKAVSLKTWKFFELAMILPAIESWEPEDVIIKLQKIAYYLWITHQITDDIKDIEEDWFQNFVNSFSLEEAKTELHANILRSLVFLHRLDWDKKDIFNFIEAIYKKISNK